ncbi:2810_t:CDS:2, partial [Cetraspora pellucida]
VIPAEVAKQTENDLDKRNFENLGQQEAPSIFDNSGPNSPEDRTPKVAAKEPTYICGSQLKELKESNNIVTFPIQRGVTNFMVIIDRRHVILKELNIKRARKKCPVLITVPNSWAKEHFERIAHIFFETFNAPGPYIANQALMTLYGIDCLSGLVIDVGYGKNAALKENIHQNLDQQFELVRTLKESDICEFTIDLERFQVVEPIFDPLLIEAIYRAISYCEPDKRTTLWDNIAFTGGSSLLKDLNKRILI